jgi:nicotinamide-nucleotide amidase
MDTAQAEIVVVGSELLLGQIVDTNSALIARHLAGIGLDLFFKTTVGDNLGRVTATLRQALTRSRVVITTGGIGPTADDVTREAVAAATGRDLVFSDALMTQIEAFFRARGLAASASNRRQALIPAGAIAIENPVGTAPAFIVETGAASVIALPGVPREMEHLLVTRVIPYLRDRYGIAGEIRLRVLKVVGLGESRLGELIADFMEKGRNPTVGTLAHLGQVDVRIAAKAADGASAVALIAPVEAEIRRRLGDLVVGADDETLEGVVRDRLAAMGGRVAIAEVGSHGAVGGRLAAGLGPAFGAGIVWPDLASAARISADPASAGEPPAAAGALAQAVARWAGTRVGVAVCLAPAPGGPPPVTVAVLAIAVDGQTNVAEQRVGGDPDSVRIRVATLTLDLMRRTLAGRP